MWGRILWGSLRARRARVLLGLLAVSLGAAIATALGTLALQVGDDVALALRAAGPNFLVQPRGAAWTPDLGGAAPPAALGAGLPEAAIARLKQSFWKHNILHVAPELTLPAEVEGAPALLVGTWFSHALAVDGDEWRTGLAALRPGWPLEGRWPREDREEVALGAALARRIGARPGARVSLSAAGRHLAPVVSGVVAAGGSEDERVFAPLTLTQGLAARPAQVDRIWLSALLKPAPRTPPPDPARDPRGYERYMCSAYPQVVAAEVEAVIEGAEALPATERIAGEAHVVGRLGFLMALLAAAGLAAATLGLLSTSAAAVVERARELALLSAIGASPRQVAGLLLAETTLVALAGGLVGWWLGSAVAAAIRGGSLGAAGAFIPLLLPVALAIAALIGVLGTLGPLRMALRLDPAQVLRG
jgi:putative ABC transport system permease protein